MTVEPEGITPDPPAGHVGRAVFGQEWTRLAYLHWPVDPEVLAPLLPPGVRPDVAEGTAWVGLIPFAMRRVTILGTPPLPYLSDFLETNVRSYTIGPGGRRGVFFHSLEADRLLPVLAARASYRLPYVWSRMRMQTQEHERGDGVTYSSRRRWPGPWGAHSRIRLSVGEPVRPTALDDWFTARWGLHSTWWGGRSVYAPVEHPRWPLHRADLLELRSDLLEVAGFPTPAVPPLVRWSPGVPVRIGRPARTR